MSINTLKHSFGQTWDIISITVPNCETKPTIVIQPDFIKIKVGSHELSGKLLFPVYPSESTWYITESRELNIELSKVTNHKWWASIVEDVEEIQVPPTARPTRDYPDHVQAMLNERGNILMAQQTRPDLVNDGTLN